MSLCFAALGCAAGQGAVLDGDVEVDDASFSTDGADGVPGDTADRPDGPEVDTRDADLDASDARPTPAVCPVASGSASLTAGAAGTECARGSYEMQTLTYTTVPRTLELDLYRPVGATGPLPTVVWIHGGGWTTGSRAQVEQALWLVCEGFAVASIDYRLSGETTSPATFPAQIHDAKAAVRYLRATAGALGLDPERFAAFGSSAGGHLAALLGSSSGVAVLEDPSQGNAGTSSRVQAVIDWYGPTDFARMDAQLLAPASTCPPGSASHGAARSPESRLLGCGVAEVECADRVALASPLTYVDELDPPYLIAHGALDCTVPPQQSTLLYDALSAATGCALHRRVLNGAHGGPEWRAEQVRAQVLDFLTLVLP
jgi:acetyl esterase/lipase